MSPKFDNMVKANRLLFAASKWIGTPWRERSCAKGSGVACHNLPRALYVECAALPEDFPVIDESPIQSKHSKVSFMAEWIDRRPEFESVPVDGYRPETGDLLGFAIGSCVNHLGVVLAVRGGCNFIHVLMKKNTCVDYLSDPTWSTRLKRIWRLR